MSFNRQAAFSKLAQKIVKPVRRACGAARNSDRTPRSRRARAVRAKCSLAGLTTQKIAKPVCLCARGSINSDSRQSRSRAVISELRVNQSLPGLALFVYKQLQQKQKSKATRGMTVSCKPIH